MSSPRRLVSAFHLGLFLSSIIHNEGFEERISIDRGKHFLALVVICLKLNYIKLFDIIKIL